MIPQYKTLYFKSKNEYDSFMSLCSMKIVDYLDFVAYDDKDKIIVIKCRGSSPGTYNPKELEYVLAHRLLLSLQS